MLKKINGVTGKVTIVPTQTMSQPKSNESLKSWAMGQHDVYYNDNIVLPRLVFEEIVDKLLAQKDKEVAERIICSAVRFKDKVWMGHRHMHALDAMHGELSYTMNRKEMIAQKTDQEQGFVTSTGRYVDRSVGWDIAFKAGQIIERKYQTEGCLYSEDLW